MSQPSTRPEAVALERDRWETLSRLLEAVPGSRTTEPSLTPEGWSVRDLVWHLAGWNELVAGQLEKMRLGTFDEAFDWATEENNERFLGSGRSATFDEAIRALVRSREELVGAMEALDEVGSRALELFAETTYQHAYDHLPELRAFLGADAEPSRPT